MTFNMKSFSIFTLVLSLSSFSVAFGEDHQHSASPIPNAALVTVPENASVFFMNLKNGQKIKTGFLVQFGVKNVKIHPAGEVIAGTGHHHLIIDSDAPTQGAVIPADATHIHFGKGQTEYKLDLKPGLHKLTLQFANGAHVSYGPALRAQVEVIVE